MTNSTTSKIILLVSFNIALKNENISLFYDEKGIKDMVEYAEKLHN